MNEWVNDDYEFLGEIRHKEISDSIIILYHIFQYQPGQEHCVQCCTYKDGVLVATVNFSIHEEHTEEEIERFLEHASDWQKIPGYHRCPCEL